MMLWNPGWETGFPSIDLQHQQLFMQLERLFLAIHDNRAEGRIAELLDFLADYVETHFATEERYMGETGYPGLQVHKAIHDDMRHRVLHLVEAHRTDPVVVTDAVIDFLTDWLVKHIDVEDRKMALYLHHHRPSDIGQAP